MGFHLVIKEDLLDLSKRLNFDLLFNLRITCLQGLK